MKCPNCGKPVEWKDNPSRPFCSDRCRLVDLGRWVEGEYRVPGDPIPSDQSEIPSADLEPDEDDISKP
jgi:endogenous inhibitor of DNA gyrase (YacG/DUF329 family)